MSGRSTFHSRFFNLPVNMPRTRDLVFSLRRIKCDLDRGSFTLAGSLIDSNVRPNDPNLDALSLGSKIGCPLSWLGQRLGRLRGGGASKLDRLASA